MVADEILHHIGSFNLLRTPQKGTPLTNHPDISTDKRLPLA
jgi:hypothetical protein